MQRGNPNYLTHLNSFHLREKSLPYLTETELLFLNITLKLLTINLGTIFF